ncbi:MAG: hypothetical protein EBW19_09780, partial [Betaproteobacteria bacterium]|nr:hypothetical protein [Betaproteobacteria bacterium]
HRPVQADPRPGTARPPAQPRHPRPFGALMLNIERHAADLAQDAIGFLPPSPRVTKADTRQARGAIACADYAGFGTAALSEAMLRALGSEARACLLAHHGVIASGEDLAAALGLAKEVEMLAAMYSQCLSLGGPALLSQEAMDAVLKAFVGYRQANQVACEASSSE